MRWKIAVGSVIGIGLAWIAYSAFVAQQEAQFANDLARRSDANKNSILKSDIGKTKQPNMIRLNDELLAEKEGGNWIVSDQGKTAYLELPFMPTPHGQWMGSDALPAGPSENPGFVGTQACAECHRENHEGFIHTGHFQTSSVVTPTNLPGSLSPPTNVLRVGDTNLHFTISQEGDRVYQQISYQQWSTKVPMDVITGSAKSGQSYLYWLGDALFQNHVSYLTSPDEWIPSPGFSDEGGTFTRAIRLNCLECHITYIEETKPPNHFNRDSAIWGISCERCHGPGKQHVEYHHQNPQQREAKFIVYPKNLPRQRQLDICGQCHSGPFNFRSKAFAFRPGDDLSEHHTTQPQDTSRVGSIHTSNQLTRLQKSECFKQSEMTCTSCHNPHQNERGKSQLLSTRCLDCHQPTNCGLHDRLGDRLAENCVTCHMPKGDNEGMELDTAAGRFLPAMIDHHIRVDQEATEAYLKQLQAETP